MIASTTNADEKVNDFSKDFLDLLGMYHRNVLAPVGTILPYDILDCLGNIEVTVVTASSTSSEIGTAQSVNLFHLEAHLPRHVLLVELFQLMVDGGAQLKGNGVELIYGIVANKRMVAQDNSAGQLLPGSELDKLECGPDQRPLADPIGAYDVVENLNEEAELVESAVMFTARIYIPAAKAFSDGFVSPVSALAEALEEPITTKRSFQRHDYDRVANMRNKGLVVLRCGVD